MMDELEKYFEQKDNKTTKNFGSDKTQTFALSNYAMSLNQSNSERRSDLCAQ